MAHDRRPARPSRSRSDCAVAKPEPPAQARQPPQQARAAAARRPAAPPTSTAVGAVVGVHDGRDRLPLGRGPAAVPRRRLAGPRPGPALRRVPRATLAGATAPVGPIVPAGDPVALLTIPRHRARAGRRRGHRVRRPAGRTRPPARHGAARARSARSVVYGRAATYGGAVRATSTELQAGDKIEVTSAQGRGRSRSSASAGPATRCRSRRPTGAARLTLVTAEGSGRLGGLTPESVVYVDADAKKGFPAPAGRAAAVPESEQSMATRHRRAAAAGPVPGPAPGADPRGHRRPSAMVDRARLGGRDAPVAIALAWATTDVVMRLLPNLI